MNVCPPEIGDELSCLNTTNWTNNTPFMYKITTTKRRATTVFDRYNYTILNIMDLSDDWEPTDYGSNDFFPIFEDQSTAPREREYSTITRVGSKFLNCEACPNIEEAISSVHAL